VHAFTKLGEVPLSAVFAHRTAAQTAHDPGRVLTDLAVMIANGGVRFVK
jgi:hypothetical protein